MSKSKTKVKLIMACAALIALSAGGGIYFATQNHNALQSAYAVTAQNSGLASFVPGASVRADEQGGENSVTSGIRFRATINKTAYENLIDTEINDYKTNCEVGMIIVPEKVFSKWEAQSEYTDILTYIKDGLGVTGEVSVVIPTANAKKTDDGYELTGVIDLLEANYLYDYQAAVYFKNGETYTYEAFSDVRSLAYVADAALNDTTENAPSDTQKTILAEKIAKTVDMRFENDGNTVTNHEVTLVTSTPDAIDLNTYFADVTASDKSFTLTSGDDVATLSDGVLTPQKNGTVTVAVSAYGGKLNYKVNLRISNPFYDGYVEVKTIAMAQWPDDNSVDVTQSDDIPEGYTKAYGFTIGWNWGVRQNLASVDISKYSTVKFKIKATDLQNPSLFHLYQGDTYLKNFYYADTSWHEIVLTKNSEGAWTMTADGTAVDGFTSTETNLKNVFNFSLGNTTEGCPDSHFVVSNIIGLPIQTVEVVDKALSANPDANGLTASDDIPEGYTKAYAFTMGWQWGYKTTLASVDISKYSLISFKIKATDLQSASLFHLYQGDTYLKNFYYADTSWHEIVLTKNAEGAWTMTVDGTAVEGFTSTETNLKDVFNFSLGNTTEGCPDSHFYVTNIMGIQFPAAIKDGYVEVAEKAMDNSMEVTEAKDTAIPEGYTKVYGFTEGWQWGYRRNLADVNISGYSTVSFMIKATDLQSASLFHLYQGDTYLKNFYYADTSWHEIVLTQDDNDVWSMTVDGTAVEGFSSTATNLKDMFNFSLGNTTEGCPDSHFYVTNIIGVKNP